MISLVARMKDHLHKCIGVQQQSASLTSESSDPAMPPEGIVGRMKRTFSQMNTVDNTSPSATLQSPAKKIKTNASMSSYVLTTTESEKTALDLKVAAKMYATNTPFKRVEH